MDISINNLQSKIRIQPKRLHQIIQKILKKEQTPLAELSVCFVTAQKIRALNIRYLNRAHTTDVLAFSFQDKNQPLMGEIIISTDAMKQNARLFNTPINDEGVLYVVHGLLHLMGYNDHTAEDIKKMRAKEQDVMRYFQKDIRNIFKLAGF